MKDVKTNRTEKGKELLDQFFKKPLMEAVEVQQDLMEANMRNIKTIVELSKENNGFISVTGYKSSNGKVADYVLQPTSREGYHNRIRKSIEAVKKMRRPRKFKAADWHRAVSEQIASWTNTLINGEKDNSFTKEKKAFYTSEKSDAVYIRNVIIISSKVTTETDKKKNYKNAVTEAKDYIRKKTPISAYQASFKLEPQKFTKVAWNGVEMFG